MLGLIPSKRFICLTTANTSANAIVTLVAGWFSVPQANRFYPGIRFLNCLIDGSLGIRFFLYLNHRVSNYGLINEVKTA